MSIRTSKNLSLIALFAVMVIALTSNFFYPVVNSFQADSEALVVGSMLYTEQKEDIPQYGLFSISSDDGSGSIELNESSSNGSGVQMNGASGAAVFSMSGGTITGNRENRTDITRIWQHDGMEVRSRILSSQQINGIQLSEYQSQIGVQGFVFMLLYRLLSHFAERRMLLWLFRGMCAGALALVLSTVILLIRKKYNFHLAAAFFITFFLSPWIRDFGANLYWVAFTWFIPMMLGLIVSLNYKKNDCWWMYILIIASIALKCACGYEYISTVMMGLIMFALVDLCICNKEDRKHIFAVIVKMGVSALLGFALILLVHASIRGNGDIGNGLQSIWQTDVLRRTLGGNPADFPEVRASLEASVIEVVAMYFKWNPTSQIIEGIPTAMFVPVIIISGCIYAIRMKKHSNQRFELPLTVLSFVASVSWFVLAKSHSYEHTHMNYVLWYFGFIQMCLYSFIVFVDDCRKKYSNS